MITPVKENVTSYMGTRDVSIVIGGSLEAPAGVMVTITCPISGTPRPDVKWYFDGKQIHETKMKSGSAAEVYIINKLRLKDSGKYTCVAENILGKHAASTYVAVGQYNSCFFFHLDLRRMLLLPTYQYEQSRFGASLVLMSDY